MSVSRISRTTIVALFAAALSACATTDTPQASAKSEPGDLQAAILEPVFTRDDVMSKTASELDATFGEPALVRREGKGEFRRYDLDRCGLIVILLADASGQMATSHIEAAAKTSADAAPEVDHCLSGGLPRLIGVGT